MVEFALVLPLFIAILFGIITFGIMAYNQVVITNASREGARAGIVSVVAGVTTSQTTSPCTRTASATPGTSTAGALATCVANSYLINNLITFGSTASSASVTQSSSGTCSTPPTNTCLLTVNISYPYTGIYVLGAITLRASTSMYYE